MPKQDIFCNSPWYELHIYWDGSFGFCCAASHKNYHDELSARYSVHNMTIREWFNSEPMKLTRLAMFADQKNSICARCHDEEFYGVTSRRHRSNQKSVIFTRSAFAPSYEQSPGHEAFEYSRLHSGDHDGLPIDIHIDLGNYCNLACKMCTPAASSRVAAQHLRWNMQDAAKYINTDWTRNDETWQRVMNELASIENLRNVHFMGGETLLTKRLEDFVDHMSACARFDLGFRLVTNGTVYDPNLLEKLAKFARVGIEVSIESLDQTNCYQRQGSDMIEVMKNLELYRSWCDGDRLTLTLRPAISALTVGSYPTLLTYANQHDLIIKSALVRNPRYLDVRVLPLEVRALYLARFDQVLEQLNLHACDTMADFNENDPHQNRLVIKNQIELCRSLLSAPTLPDADQLQAEMVRWCKRWDTIYGYDARSLYPEFHHMLDKHAY